MTPVERKVAFRARADRARLTLNAAAYEACGVTWVHLSEGIAGRRPLGADVKQKFAAFIGHPVEEVFDMASADAA